MRKSVACFGFCAIRSAVFLWSDAYSSTLLYPCKFSSQTQCC
ncbi:hypothetical protein X975_12573, partial [Stegodyphus mimosarum]